MSHVRLIHAADRFMEAVGRIQRQRAVAPIQDRLQQEMADAFEAQGTAFLTRFTRLARLFPEVQESASESDWTPLFDAAELETLELFEGPITQAIRDAMLASARVTIADLGMDLAFDLAHPEAVTFIRTQGAARVAGINATTRTYLRTILTQATDEGWSYQRTAKAIKERYHEFAVGEPQLHIRSRAELVAVTETGDAYEEGTLQTGRQFARTGLAMEKHWLDVGDRRVDPDCRANTAAGWIPLEATFPTGHLRPLEHPACRCTMLMRLAREQTAAVAAA